MCWTCIRETCRICAGPIGPAAPGGYRNHICTFAPEPPIPEPVPGMKQGVEWRRCPHSKCLKIFNLADGCNAVMCRILGCQTQFCITCGQKATHDSGHWKPGMPCPRFTNRDDPRRAIFDGNNLGNGENEDQPETWEKWPEPFQPALPLCTRSLKYWEALDLGFPVPHFMTLKVHSGWFAECLTDHLRRNLIGVNSVIRAAESTEAFLAMTLQMREGESRVWKVDHPSIEEEQPQPAGLVDSEHAERLRTFLEQLQQLAEGSNGWLADFISRRCLDFVHDVSLAEGQTHETNDARFATLAAKAQEIREYPDSSSGDEYRSITIPWNLFLKSFMDFFVEAAPDLKSWFEWTSTDDFDYLSITNVSVEIAYRQREGYEPYLPQLPRVQGGHDDARKAVYMAVVHQINPLIQRHTDPWLVVILQQVFKLGVASFPRSFEQDRVYNLENLFYLAPTVLSEQEGYHDFIVSMEALKSSLKTWTKLRPKSLSVTGMPDTVSMNDVVHFMVEFGEGKHDGRITKVHFVRTKGADGEIQDKDAEHKWLHKFFARIVPFDAECLDFIFQDLREQVPKDWLAAMVD